jgi:hypothetical protein
VSSAIIAIVVTIAGFVTVALVHRARIVVKEKPPARHLATRRWGLRRVVTDVLALIVGVVGMISFFVHTTSRMGTLVARGIFGVAAFLYAREVSRRQHER